MNIQLRMLAMAGLLATTVWAGLPLICHRIEIGNAKSLPWKGGENWNAPDPAYPLARLSDDTLALLTPSTPVDVRRETIRRAGIYAARDPRVMAELTARLVGRVLDAEAAGKADAMAWFDAGYWVETVRQASYSYRYNTLTDAEKRTWKTREGIPGIDGYAWVEKAVRMGAKGVEGQLALMASSRDRK